MVCGEGAEEIPKVKRYNNTKMCSFKLTSRIEPRNELKQNNGWKELSSFAPEI